MDVLPLYIVLLLLFPPILWLLLRNADAGARGLGRALCPDLGVRLEPAGLSERHWFFNPFAWQLLFVFGAWCALGGADAAGAGAAFAGHALRSRSPICVFAFAITHDLAFSAAWLTWCRAGSANWMYPIDKTNLDVLRFAHFLALAAVTVWFIPRDWPALKSPLAAAGDPVRAAFAGNLLPRACSWPSPRISSMVEIVGGVLMQVRGQRGRHSHNDCHGLADLMVQAVEGRGRGTAQAAAGRRPRRRRGMRTWTAAVRAVCRLRDGLVRRIAQRNGRYLRGAGLSAVRRQPA